MAQGSRFSAPKFNGGGLWDPRQPGVAWPEPIEDQPYVEGTNGMSGGCGCGGTSGVGQIDFSKFQAPSISNIQRIRPDVLKAIRNTNLQNLDQSTQFYTPAVNFALANIAKEEAEAKKKKKMLIIGGAVVIGVGLIFMANR